MTRKLQKIRHDFVLLGETPKQQGGLTVCMYLSDDDTPFLLGYGTKPGDSGYHKISSRELCSGAWDDHLQRCDADWVKGIAERLLSEQHLKWEELQEIFRSL